jgi:hypothetical protein
MLVALMVLRHAYPHENRYLDFYGAPVVWDCVIGLIVVFVYRNVARIPATMLLMRPALIGARTRLLLLGYPHDLSS